MNCFKVGSLLLLVFCAGTLFSQEFHPGDYRNGIEFPKPEKVTPGATVTQAPSDAIVLFDGTNQDMWDGGPWDLKDGVLTVKPQGGDLHSTQKFGSCQLHLEFRIPEMKGEGQARGNSGLFLMDHYEVQILDSYSSSTYYDGQCSAIYKQSPPLVNSCKKPGEWQTLDVTFTRPIFRFEGEDVVEVIRPAYITVYLNGVLTQNHYALKGDTFWHRSPYYVGHGDREPVRLQDHLNPISYRNIWIREIPDSNDIVYPVNRTPYYNEPKAKPADVKPAGNVEKKSVKEDDDDDDDDDDKK